MIIRTVLGCLLLASGCQPGEEHKTNDQAEASKAPLDPNSPEALILGKWKRVKYTPDPKLFIPKDYQFFSNGTYTVLTQDPFEGMEVAHGTYTIQGNDLSVTINPEFPNRKLTIELIDKQRMITSATWQGHLQTSYYERMEPSANAP